MTDGSSSLNVLSLSQKLLNSVSRGVSKNEEPLPLPFNFPVKFHIVTIASPDEPCLAISIPLFHVIIYFLFYILRQLTLVFFYFNIETHRFIRWGRQCSST